MVIQEITLLTTEEYQRFRSLISDIQKSWWLQDRTPQGYQTIVSCFDADVHGADYYRECYVRPALRIKADCKPGETIEVFAYAWTVLDVADGVALLLCNDVVTMRTYDKRSRIWEQSDIKAWLNGWLAKRTRTTDIQKHRRYKFMNECGMQYLCNEFIRLWLVPMTFTLTLSFVLLQSTCRLGDIILVPTWLHVFSVLMSGLVALISGASALFVLYSPHKDTGLRRACNTGLILSVLVMFWNSLTFFGLASILCTTAIVAINHRYLQCIKYYS